MLPVTALIVLLILLTGLLFALVISLVVRLNKNIVENTEELRSLRLDSRARVKTVAMRTGADPEAPRLRQLRRLGRQTQGKRIVVGGEPEAEQHQALSRQVRSGDNDD
jgi:uncharacterized SAM-binding protein YcdF (DUF218 family)